MARSDRLVNGFRKYKHNTQRRSTFLDKLLPGVVAFLKKTTHNLIFIASYFHLLTAVTFGVINVDGARFEAVEHANTGDVRFAMALTGLRGMLGSSPPVIEVTFDMVNAYVGRPSTNPQVRFECVVHVRKINRPIDDTQVGGSTQSGNSVTLEISDTISSYPRSGRD